MDTLPTVRVAPRWRETLETAVIVFVIGLIGISSVVYDGASVWHLGQQEGLAGAGRGLCAAAQGWMCGWYLTMKFPPTHGFLTRVFFALAGHVVALIAFVIGFAVLGLSDWIGTDPDKAAAIGITCVSFAPVAAFFCTQVANDRSVHLVSGFGIGALGYVVLFGLPG
jgi:hypothetical protein